MKNKALKVLTTSALLASLAAPLAAPVSAADNISASPVPTVSDDAKNTALGTIKVVVPAGTTITSGDTLVVKLPSDVTFSDDFSGVDSGDTDSASNGIQIPATYNGELNEFNDGSKFALTPSTVTAGDDELRINLEVTDPTDTVTLENDAAFYIRLGDIDLDSVSEGPIEVTLDAPPNSGFTSGKVTVGKVNSNGSVTLTASNTETANDDFTFDLRIKENTVGSLENDDESLKLTLPDGFEWDTANESKTLTTVYGDTIPSSDYDITVDEDELTITYTGTGTTNASAWDLNGLGFHVANEDDIDAAGDITVSVSGATNVDVSDLVVGSYGEYKAGVSAKSTPTVKAGRDDQEIGDLVLKEDIEGTLVPGRTVTLTLPEGARWQEQYLMDTKGNSYTGNRGFDGNPKSDAGIGLTFQGYTGTDERTAKFQVSGNDFSSDNAELKIENIKVALQAGYTGDLVVEVGGTAGVTGKVVAAKVQTPVTASVDEAKGVKIGLAGQQAGELTIKENFVGAISDDRVTLDLPAGVTFDGTPKVEVTEGDLKITNVTRGADDNQLSFTVDRESSKTASTIKVSGINLKLNRTVAEGDVTLKVQGPAVAETDAYSDWTDSDSAAKVVIAKVTTPAPTDTTASNIVFKLNSKTFTVDGVEKEMDAAPLVGWDRAYLPVRFAANALNVSDDSIIWDDKTSTFTVFKGDRVVSGKVGDKFLTVNGAKVPMDVPVWRNKTQTNNRVMVPIRYLANALNANIEWNKETSEITIEAAK